MNLKDYTTLTFDCYGTLIDWETGIVTAARRSLGGGEDFTDDEIMTAFANAESAEQRANPEKLYPDVLNAVLLQMVQALGVDATRADANAFGNSVQNWPAFPDTAEALAYLRQHYKLVIISNVDRGSFSHSNKRLGVDFDLIVTAQDVGSYKPDLQNFRHTIAELGKMGVQQAEILHVAQSLHHDIEPAQEMGLPTVWVNRRHAKKGLGATSPPKGDVKPNLTVKSLGEFANLHRKQT